MVSVDPPFGRLSVEEVRHAFQASAMLDAIVEANATWRYFKYTRDWTKGVDLGQLDDGSGNNMFALFLASRGGLLKGFDHESQMSPFPDEKDHAWPGVFDEVPQLFRPALSKLNPGESLPLDTTFCVWRTEPDATWQRGTIDFPSDADDGGFRNLTSLIPMDASAYLSWAKGYYERDINAKSVNTIYTGATLTLTLLEALGVADRRDQINANAAEIGWPLL